MKDDTPLKSLAHEQNSIFKWKQYKFHDPYDQIKYVHTDSPAIDNIKTLMDTRHMLSNHHYASVKTLN